MITSDESVWMLYRVAKFALQDADDPEVLAKLEKVNKLADQVYHEHFAGKQSKREFGVFIISLLHYFAAQFPGHEEEGEGDGPERAKSQGVA